MTTPVIILLMVAVVVIVVIAVIANSGPRVTQIDRTIGTEKDAPEDRDA